MLDFAEVVGRYLADEAFRDRLLTLLASLPAGVPLGSYIEFEKPSYDEVDSLLAEFIAPARYSHSLYVMGEVLRVFKGDNNYLSQLDFIAGRLKQPPAAPAADPGPPPSTSDYFAVLGAFVVDPDLRSRFIADGLNVPGIPATTEFTPWLGAFSEPEVSDAAVAFCDDRWACGCGVRIYPYAAHLHPRPAMENCLAARAAS